MPASCAPFTTDAPVAAPLGKVYVKAQARQSLGDSQAPNFDAAGLFEVDCKPAIGELFLVTLEAGGGGLGGQYNGVWERTGENSMARASAANSAAKIANGLIVEVQNGDPDAGLGTWQLLTVPPIVLGTTPLVFAKIGLGAATINAEFNTAFTNTPPTAIALT